MGRALNNKSASQKAQKPLTSFFQAKAKKATPDINSIRQNDVQRPQAQQSSQRRANSPAVSQDLQENGQHSKDVHTKEENSGKKSEYFKEAHQRPSKRARIASSVEYELLEEEGSGGHDMGTQERAVNGIKTGMGTTKQIPQHVDGLHQRFQVSYYLEDWIGSYAYAQGYIAFGVCSCLLQE